jgi:hypothetical protein
MQTNLPEGDFSRYLIFLPRTKTELKERAAGPYLYSPDAFPIEGWKPETLQSTHESEYWLLHTGVDHVFDAPRYAAIRDRMHDVLNRSYTEFLEGDSIHARELLEEFRSLVSQSK